MIRVGEIFDVRYGHSLELNALTQAPIGQGVAFVSRLMGSNGVSAYVQKIPGLSPSPAGILTCALGGNGVVSTFIQEQEFYSGRDMALLYPKVELSRKQMLYYCLCIKANRFRYSYGRQANRTLASIRIPSLDEIPAWVNDADLHQFDGADNPALSAGPSNLNFKMWEWFELQSLFQLKKGKRLTKGKMQKGETPFIGAIDSNNGYREWISNPPNHKSGAITVTYNGSVAEAFYQPSPFWASDDVNVLYPKFKMTPAIGLFICTVIRLEKYRFNYGRKWHLERMKESKIKLPVDSKGKPDWSYMENYIKSLPFSSQI